MKHEKTLIISKYFCSYVPLLLLLAVICAEETDARRPSTRVIRTSSGTIRGLIIQLYNQQLQPVEAFLGVPYAAAPIGPLRFKPPEKPASWKGVRDVNKVSNVCPQRLPNITDNGQAVKVMPRGRYEYLKRLSQYLVRQSEDCLYLNIYIPARASREVVRLPTLLFVHGESFDWGTGNAYDGSVLASAGDAVVITLNYRLGLFGFFSTPDGSTKGNLALHDILAALKWIQRNIEQFGGDPHNVTVCGHGSGAVLTNLLMLTPKSRGLFTRVILMSGSALSPTALNYEPMNVSLNLAEMVGCPTNIPSHMMQCMRQKSVYELLSADQTSYQDSILAFGPIIDGDLVENYPDLLMTSTHRHQYQSYDLMFSVSKVEMYFLFSSHEVRFGLEEIKRNKIIQNYMNKTVPYHKEELAAIAINEYTDWTKTIQHPINMLDATSEIIGDADVVAPLVLTANLHSNRPYKSSYFSVFSYQTRDGDYSDRMGCIHGEELPYLFGAPLAGSKIGHFQEKYSQSEQQLARAVMAFWINFARTGNPNLHTVQTHDDNRFKKIIWQPYDVTDKKYLSFGLKPRIRDHYRAHKLSIWLHLLPQLIPVYPGGSARIPQTTKASPTTTMVTEAIIEISTKPTTDTNQVIHSAVSVPSIRGTPYDKSHSNMSSSDRKNKNKIHSIYSTALTVTIAVGCSLLIINIIIFIGIYYQRDRSKRYEKEQPGGDIRTPGPGMYGSTVQVPSDSYELTDKPTIFSGPVYVGTMGRAPPSSPASQAAANNQLQNTLKRKQNPHFYPGDLLPPPPPVIIMEPGRK